MHMLSGFGIKYDVSFGHELGVWNLFLIEDFQKHSVDFNVEPTFN